MDDTRKTQVTIVLVANLALSVAIGFAIWNGGSSANRGTGAQRSPGVRVGAEPVSATAIATSVARRSDPGNYFATTRSAAAARAGFLAGRSDPMSCSSYRALSASKRTPAPDENVVHPPLRKSSAQQAPQTPHLSEEAVKVLPPPPAMPAERMSALSLSDRKSAPPSKMAGITVTAVIGNKAMLSLRREGSNRRQRPEIVCLAAGEQIRTGNNVPVSVIAVEPYRVILDVDGERFVKSLPEIR